MRLLREARCPPVLPLVPMVLDLRWDDVLRSLSDGDAREVLLNRNLMGACAAEVLVGLGSHLFLVSGHG
jgi:hypothetical protein